MEQAQGVLAGTRLLILFLLMLLQAQHAQAAPWRARGLAVPVGNGHLNSQADLAREPWGHPREVDGGDGDPTSGVGSRADMLGDRMDVAPAPRLDRALELAWHPRGPARPTYEAKIGTSSQRSSEILKEILKVLHKAAAYETGGDAVEKEALQEGGSRPAPVSGDKRGAIQSPGMPGADGSRSSGAADAKDFQRYCIEGAVAVLGSMLLGMACCCAICLWRKRKRRLAAAKERESDTSSWSSYSDSSPSRPSTPQSQAQHPAPPPLPKETARLPRGPGGPAPTSPVSRPARPPAPRPPWLSSSASRLMRDRPSDLQPRDELRCASTRQATEDDTADLSRPPSLLGCGKELGEKKVMFVD